MHYRQYELQFDFSHLTLCIVRSNEYDLQASKTFHCRHFYFCDALYDEAFVLHVHSTANIIKVRVQSISYV